MPRDICVNSSFAAFICNTQKSLPSLVCDVFACVKGKRERGELSQTVLSVAILSFCSRRSQSNLSGASGGQPSDWNQDDHVSIIPICLTNGTDKAANICNLKMDSFFFFLLLQ